MAGHSKWANIRYRKAQQDAKKGKSFTKLIREIGVGAKLGGGDPANNPRLRIAIDKALAQNMTRDTIQRAIQRAVSNQNNDHMESVLYEGYGPAGSAILVDAVTDNRNRTIADVRSSFTKFNGSLAVEGAVSFLFSHLGTLYVPELPSEQQLLILLEHEAIVDIFPEDEQQPFPGQAGMIHTTPSGLYTAEHLLKDLNIPVQECALAWIPKSMIALPSEAMGTFEKLIERLSNLDDVQEVYHNVETEPMSADDHVDSRN